MNLQQKAIANYYLAKLKMMDFFERAKKEELGASEMVVVIILIVIVIGVAVTFKKELTTFITTFFSNLRGKIDGIW